MTPGQCRAARSWLKWSIRHTAKAAGISRNTVLRFEQGGGVLHATVLRLREAFEAAGIGFQGKTGVTYDPPEGQTDAG